MTHCDAANAAPHEDTFVPTISDVIGVGESAHRLVRVGRWNLIVHGATGTDPEIPDTELAPLLGMTLHHLRELSGRHEKAKNIDPRVYRTVRETGGRPAKQRFYNEADALFLVTRSDKREAIALTKEMIAVYMAARRGLLRPVFVAPVAPAIPAEVLAAIAAIPSLIAQVGTLTDIARENATRLGALEQNLASGIVGPERGSEITKRLYAASLRATGGDKTRAKSVRGRWVQTLRNATQFNGPRSAWRNLPRAALAVVEAHLDAIEREADLTAKTAPVAAQAKLPFSAPN